MTQTTRHSLAALFFLLLLVASSRLLKQLVAFSFANDHCSHIVLIPFVTVVLIFLNRTHIFSNVRYSVPAGALVLGSGAALYIAGLFTATRLTQNDYLSLMAFSQVLLWLGGFLLFYGTAAFRAALFPLLFLLFVVPLPGFILQPLILVLQTGSTEAVELLFKLTGTVFHRDGFLFGLPGMTIHVAKECSGIRSSIALFITSLLAGHMFLKSGRNKLILALMIFPVTMFKNGIRIVTLSLLAIHVDQRILTSSLHREGGIPFFVLALLLMAPILGILRKTEKKRLPEAAKQPAPASL